MKIDNIKFRIAFPIKLRTPTDDVRSSVIASLRSNPVKYNALWCFLDCFVPRNDERLKTSFTAVWGRSILALNNLLQIF